MVDAWNRRAGGSGEGAGHGIVKMCVSIFVVVVLLVVVFGSFFIVQPGEAGMLFSVSGGLRPTVYGEGMHLKVPLFERAIKMNLRVQKQSEDVSAASADLQDVATTVAVNFRIDSEQIQTIYRTIGQSSGSEDYMQTEIINPIVQESVKAATAKYTAEELIANRTTVKADIDTRINARLSAYHIIVTDVSITDFKFSDQFTQAIESKVTAQQNALREQLNIEVAKNIAQQKIETAKGDAQAIEIVNEQLRNSPEYVSYLLVQRWNGAMPLAVGAQSLLSIPSQVVGATR